MKQVRRLSSVLLIVCLLLSFATHVRAESISEQYTSQLIHSEYVLWNASMSAYNCYGFAIGITGRLSPGWRTNRAYDQHGSISAMAELVYADLQDLGSDCILQQTVRPTSRSGWDNVIAMRKETLYRSVDENGLHFNDFHFATLTAGGEWYHKPGGTAILKFKEAPSNDTVWISEWVTDQGYGISNTEYDSTIIYMSYKASHGTLMEVWTENDYHSGKVHYYEFEYICPDCGEVTDTEWVSLPCRGPTCVYPWNVEIEHEAS